MARLRLELDTDTYTRLVDRAVEERRPVAWQAEVLLRQVLGSPENLPSGGQLPTAPTEQTTREAARAEAVDR